MEKFVYYMPILILLASFILPNSLIIKNTRKGTYRYYTNEKYWHRLSFYFIRIKKAKKAKKLGVEFDWDKDKETTDRIIDQCMEREFIKKKDEFVAERIAGGYYENVSPIKPKREEV